jgi:tripartite-type tricarboxylate transporter receptor subunit TctC
MRAFTRFTLIALVVVLMDPVAHAQAPDYPTRPVTFVVPFAPGGVTSLFARLLAQNLEQRFGKPFVVENRPGGGGVTAAMGVINAEPDGHTIIMASSTMLAINVSVRKHLPYDPRTDFAPIALLARVPFVLLVNAERPIRSVSDLVTLAKSRPGELSYGTPGPGTFHHLNAELFQTQFGLKLNHVPYKGSVPALNDLAGGHIDFMFCDVPPALPLIQSGKLRALGVTTAARVPAAPDIPPLAEAGIPGHDTASWHTVSTGANVPAPIIDKLYRAVVDIMRDEAVKESLVRAGAIPQVSPPPAALKDFVKDEIVRWGKVVERAGIAGSQ